jgi:hypothetical protein
VIATSGAVDWGNIGGNIEDQDDLIEALAEKLSLADAQMYLPYTDKNHFINLINSIETGNSGGLTESDVMMLFPNINTAINQAIAAIPTSTGTIDLTDIWIIGGY